MKRGEREEHNNKERKGEVGISEKGKWIEWKGGKEEGERCRRKDERWKKRHKRE